MGIFDKFKKPKSEESPKTTEKPVAPVKAASKVSAAPKAPAKPKAKAVAQPVTAKAEPQAEAVTPRQAPEAGKRLKGSNPVSRIAIVRPLITEKAALLSSYNQYVFAVRPSANKLEVKKAIRTMYHVEPLQVRIITKRGKQVRSGRNIGTTKNWKKAIVRLRPEDKIQIYEGV